MYSKFSVKSCHTHKQLKFEGAENKKLRQQFLLYVTIINVADKSLFLWMEIKNARCVVLLTLDIMVLF